MKKKIVSVLLVAAMAVSMFTGCGSKSDSKKSDSKSGEKTLEVWVPPLDDATEKNWGDLLKDWEKENDCKVNLTVIPWDKYRRDLYNSSEFRRRSGRWIYVQRDVPNIHRCRCSRGYVFLRYR